MLAHEVLEDKLQNYVFSIYMRDIDNVFLLKARNGIHTPDDAKDFPNHIIAKYFDKRGKNLA